MAEITSTEAVIQGLQIAIDGDTPSAADTDTKILKITSGGALAMIDSAGTTTAINDHTHDIDALDLENGTAETTADDADLIPIFDDSAGANRMMTRANFLSGVGGGSGVPDYILLKQTATATFSAGAWRTRPLDTESYDGGGHCTLASNQFALAAGTYIIKWWAVAYFVGTHQTRIYNVTDGALIAGGSPGKTDNTYDLVNSQSGGSAVFTIASSKTFELQHYCATTQSGNGMGADAAYAGAGTNIFAEVEMWKIA